MTCFLAAAAGIGAFSCFSLSRSSFCRRRFSFLFRTIVLIETYGRTKNLLMACNKPRMPFFRGFAAVACVIMGLALFAEQTPLFMKALKPRIETKQTNRTKADIPEPSQACKLAGMCSCNYKSANLLDNSILHLDSRDATKKETAKNTNNFSCCPVAALCAHLFQYCSTYKLTDACFIIVPK